MNKKIIIMIILVLIPLVIGLTLQEFNDKELGDKVLSTSSTSNELITYEIQKEYEVIGYEDVYKNVTIQEEICDLVENGTYKENGSVKYSHSCSTQDVQKEVVDDTKQGDPIYQEKEIKSITYAGETYDFDVKGCFICGDKLYCYSKTDGYSVNRGERFQCNPQPGETYYVKDLTTNTITDESKGVNLI